MMQKAWQSFNMVETKSPAKWWTVSTRLLVTRTPTLNRNQRKESFSLPRSDRHYDVTFCYPHRSLRISNLFWKVISDDGSGDGTRTRLMLGTYLQRDGTAAEFCDQLGSAKGASKPLCRSLPGAEFLCSLTSACILESAIMVAWLPSSLSSNHGAPKIVVYNLSNQMSLTSSRFFRDTC